MTVLHPHLSTRRAAGPALTHQQLPRGTTVQRFNSKIAMAVTTAVGSMWCAYVFGIFNLISLPTAIKDGSATLVSWVAQTFLQLVLLSVIMVGQNVQAKAADKRAIDTFDDAEHILRGQETLYAQLEALHVFHGIDKDGIKQDPPA